MTDNEIILHLRRSTDPACHEAADRIEGLRKDVATLNERLAKANLAVTHEDVEALRARIRQLEDSRRLRR